MAYSWFLFLLLVFQSACRVICQKCELVLIRYINIYAGMEMAICYFRKKNFRLDQFKNLHHVIRKNIFIYYIGELIKQLGITVFKFFIWGGRLWPTSNRTKVPTIVLT